MAGLDKCQHWHPATYVHAMARKPRIALINPWTKNSILAPKERAHRERSNALTPVVVALTVQKLWPPRYAPNTAQPETLPLSSSACLGRYNSSLTLTRIQVMRPPVHLTIPRVHHPARTRLTTTEVHHVARKKPRPRSARPRPRNRPPHPPRIPKRKPRSRSKQRSVPRFKMHG
jgi:hypothetical protein